MSTAKKHLVRPSTILSHLLPKTKPKQKQKRKKKRRREISLLYLFLILPPPPSWSLPHPNQDLSFFKPQFKSFSFSKLFFPSMATENEEAPRPALPPYPEMILTAVKSINDKNGSNKSAISKFIESKYGELPESHTSLLTAHLARMKESGELIFLKNNYFITGPGSPPKRGRGRPPKAKDPLAPASKEPSSPKPRGRPPKAKDVVAEAVAKATSGMPKSRGRPPKKAREETTTDAADADADADADAAANPVAKKGRGRPPKVKPTEQPQD